MKREEVVIGAFYAARIKGNVVNVTVVQDLGMALAVWANHAPFPRHRGWRCVDVATGKSATLRYAANVVYETRQCARCGTWWRADKALGHACVVKAVAAPPVDVCEAAALALAQKSLGMQAYVLDRDTLPPGQRPTRIPRYYVGIGAELYGNGRTWTEALDAAERMRRRKEAGDGDAKP